MSKLIPVQGTCSPTCGVVWLFLPKPEVKHTGRSSAGPEGCCCPGGRQLLAGRFVLQCSEQGWHQKQELPHPKMPPCLPMASPCTPGIWSLSTRVQNVLLMLFVSSNFLKLSDLDWQMYSDFLICFLHIFAVFFHKNYSVQQLERKQSTARRYIQLQNFAEYDNASSFFFFPSEKCICLCVSSTDTIL